MGKPKSHVVVARKKKRKSDNSSDTRNNPFEVRFNRRKHDVMGQKIRSGRGLPGVARSRAVQKRKKTLLQEYRSRHKTGRLVDRRFGEYNDHLSVEEKAAQRFLLEKKKRHERPGLFNLEEDGNEEGLTHFGQSLGDIEKFSDVQLSDDDVEKEDIRESHFGGFLKKKKSTPQQDSDVPKSRKEIMNELVAKSKQMKYERQTAQQEAEELMETLDSQWKEIRGTLEGGGGGGGGGGGRGGEDYDRAVRELLYEKRARATDRLKTDEEVAKDEREKLVAMEADRVRRMKREVAGGRSQDELTEEHTSADAIAAKSKGDKGVRFMVRYEDGVLVAPDAGDTNTCDGEIQTKKDCGENGEAGEDGSGEEGEGSEEGSGEMEEEGENDEEGGGEDAESDVDSSGEFGSDLESEGSSEEEQVEEEKEDRVTAMSREAAEELPYTFTMPTSLSELLALTAGRTPEECVTVIERIYSCYHPSLSPDNKHLLEDFLELLLTYCCQLGKECTQNSLHTLNNMSGPLLKLARLNSVHMARVFHNRLSSIHKTWKATRTQHFPSFDHVILFQLVGVIFPSSDFRHPITTPAMISMGQILLKSAVKNYRDLVLGLMLCEILITLFISSSKRFMPELVTFVTSCTALISCCCEGEGGESTLRSTVFHLPFTSDCKLRAKISKGVNKCPSNTSLVSLPSVLQLVLQQDDKEDDPTINASLIASCLQLVLKLCRIYSDLPSFPEIFSAVAYHLQHAPSSLPENLKLLVEEVVDVIGGVSSSLRPVLQLLKRKPKSIKFYEPSYSDIYDVRKRRQGASKTANERQKLRYKVKMERKGAIRELRKDSHFLGREKIKDARERDADRERKTRQIVHDLQNMQHEAKMERLTRHRKR